MTHISSEEWRKNSIIFINLRKKLKKILLYFKGVPTFSQYFVSKCAGISEQNSMRWIFLSGWGLRVPNFRTITYVTLEQKSGEGGEEKGEKVQLFELVKLSETLTLIAKIWRTLFTSSDELAEMRCSQSLIAEVTQG